MKWPLYVLAAFLLLTTALVSLARRHDSGWIAFARHDVDGVAIFLMTGDGHAVRRVTANDLCGNIPDWSPDARWISFHDGCDPAFELMRARPSGHAPQVVGKGLAYHRHWSPDGEWVVLARSGPNYDELVLVDAVTGADRPLAENYAYPQWSPDGEWIYAPPFYLARSSLDRIHIATGRVEQVLPADWRYPGRLSWSPDARQIVLGLPLGQRDALFIMSPDGGALEQIPVDVPSPRLAEPQWSPDGEWIAFLGGEIFDTHQVYRVRPDGSKLQQLFAGGGPVWNLQWSPDGEWLLFESEDERERDILRLRADGSSLQNLTPDPGFSTAPRYAPVAGLRWHPVLMSLLVLGAVVARKMGQFFR